MRWADRIVAAGLFFLGLGVAWKASELPIGIIPREGPGGGMFPFWLSLGISALAAAVFVQSLVRGRRAAKPGGTEEPAFGAEEPAFVTLQGLSDLLRVGIPGLVMVLLINVISLYLAAALFLVYSLVFFGRHRLTTSIAVALGVPVGVYLIFEKFLIIPLPKGYLDKIFDLLN